MTNPTEEHPLTERYLLGDLPDEERDRLELRLLEDPEAFAEVEAAETDLIDRYVRDELTADEHRRFERNLLPSARIAERVALARQLHRELEERRRQQVVTPFAPRRAERPARSVPTRLAWAATILLALAAGALAMANLDLRDRLGQTEQARLAAVQAADLRAEGLRETTEGARQQVETLERTLAEREDEVAALRERVEELADDAERAGAEPAAQAARPVSTALFLALASRSADGSGILDRAEIEDGGAVELQLDLDRQRPEGGLQATVERRGTAVWQVDDLQVVRVNSETMVPLLLPKEVLLAGRYTIELTQAGTRVGYYHLTVH